MANGVGGFIDDNMKKALDEYLDAVIREETETKAAIDKAKSYMAPEEFGLEQYTEPRIAAALEAYEKADEDTKKAYRDDMNKARSETDVLDEAYYTALENKMLQLESAETWWRDDLYAWIDGLFGETLNPMFEIDVAMPTGMAGINESIGGMIAAMVRINTIDLETYLDDGLKLYAANKQLVERIRIEEEELR